MLVVSDGHAPVKIPDVRGQTFDAAKAALEGAGFKVTRGDDAFSDTYTAGQVAATNPAVGQTIAYGGNVALVVSKGPDLVTVPDVISKLLGGALDVLAQSGLTGTVNGPIQWAQPVKSQSIPQGTQVPRGTLVTMGL